MYTPSGRRGLKFDTHPDFIHHVLFLPEEERNMVIKYQNIFDIDKEMARILRKKHRTVEESMYLASWVAGMYDTYVDLNTKSDEEEDTDIDI